MDSKLLAVGAFLHYPIMSKRHRTDDSLMMPILQPCSSSGSARPDVGQTEPRADLFWVHPPQGVQANDAPPLRALKSLSGDLWIILDVLGSRDVKEHHISL